MPVVGEVDGFDVDAERVTGVLDIHISLVAGEGQGPTATVEEVGISGPEQSRERSTAAEAASRSGAAPESVGAKRAASEQGSSGRPLMKPWVCSKM
jgi:hypothetical protein